ncbi:hypothetical protein E8E12_002497 [Didymella heteroderae]|uniref:2,6-dihydroxypyridine 3-monooxygenase substrate binding domain-containing protein n=1 Tax=Didymella heteroderae TaxID=1769908 RepID=A0A9P5C0I0_9PLEO|nr:hypothetical protein E8E12_002497 [Didymella heteroderae]
MTPAHPKNIAIVGGSLGGLLTGVALKHLRKDLNIRILERNPTPLLHDQGAGVVAGRDVQEFFKEHDRTKTPLTVTSHQRLYLDRSGNVIDRENREQHMTSWDLLYHVLRANFDAVESDYAQPPPPEAYEGTSTYDYGHQVTDIDFQSSDALSIKAKTSKGEDVTFDADILIGADGPSSTIRKFIDSSVQRKYAGYVAWRGTVPETQVSQAATDVFVEKFPFFHTEGIQILAYTIPGHNGTLEPGKRLLNWVWYVNYEEESPEHVELMTDKDGKRHHITLPPGGITERVWERQKKFASDVLPPQFAELVNKTKVPFIQAITDVVSPAALLSKDNRVLLIGDALAGFRPHTAASTNQAALDAMELAKAIDRVLEGADKEEVFKDWEKSVLDYAHSMQQHGVDIGNRR